VWHPDAGGPQWKVDFECPARWSTAIVAYLRRAPHAGDTAEGIARWWLGAAPDEFGRVADALNRLERLQVVQRWTSADGREHFRIGPALLADLKQP
jgi:hypothetical protein